MITFKHTGNFKNTETFFARAAKMDFTSILDSYGVQGVTALSLATPSNSGETAGQWSYEIVRTANQVSIFWCNSHVNNGVNIAVILQYGHGTGTGGYVQGRDYINPAIRPIFDQIAEEAWKKVMTA
jgi:hypothetical protein